MPSQKRTCNNCRFHQVHQVWGKRESNDSWYQYDGSRCHSPEAQRNYRPDKTGGVKLGKFVWDCNTRYWEPEVEA